MKSLVKTLLCLFLLLAFNSCSTETIESSSENNNKSRDIISLQNNESNIEIDSQIFENEYSRLPIGPLLPNAIQMTLFPCGNGTVGLPSTITIPLSSWNAQNFFENSQWVCKYYYFFHIDDLIPFEATGEWDMEIITTYYSNYYNSTITNVLDVNERINQLSMPLSCNSGCAVIGFSMIDPDINMGLFYEINLARTTPNGQTCDLLYTGGDLLSASCP